jgi:hypothetical protein
MALSDFNDSVNMHFTTPESLSNAASNSSIGDLHANEKNQYQQLSKTQGQMNRSQEFYNAAASQHGQAATNAYKNSTIQPGAKSGSFNYDTSNIVDYLN